MDPQTLELLRCLQSGPYDEPAWKHLREMLRTQRRVLRAQQDLSTIKDLLQLLDNWAQACDNPRIAADVLREAADVAERDLSQPAAAADLRKRAVTLGKLEARGASSPQATTGTRRKDPKDLNEAIEAYERALEADADMETVYHLAELYSQRGDPGDAQQAADLYSTLGDLLGHPAGLPMLQRALEHVPNHTEARKLLAQYESAKPTSARPQPSRPIAARPERTMEELGPAPTIHSAPNSASLRARTQSNPTRGNASNPARAISDPRTRVPTPAYASGAPAPLEHGAPRMAAPAPAGSGDPRKTTPGIAPSIVQSNLASGGKTYGARATEPRQGNAAHAFAPEAIAPEPAPEPPMRSGKASPPLRVATPSETSSAKAPPPLRAAERRAAGQLPGPHPAPVITILQSAQPAQSIVPASDSVPPAASIAPSATSLSPSGTTEPLTSLSPVVTDDSALERSRARLSATRARKRKLAAGAFAATAVAALAVLVIVPRTLEDARQFAQGIFGNDNASSTSASTTTSASRPDSDPSQQMAAGKQFANEIPAGAVTAGGAAPSVTETPIPGIPTSTGTEPTAAKSPSEEAATATPTKAPAPQPPAESEKPATKGPVVRPLIELVNQRGGKLTDPQLMAALEKAAPKLEQCYADALEKKPRLKGRLILAWTVRPNGKVTGAKKQGGTIKDVDLARCTVDVISGIRFPKPKKQAVLIRLPLEYRKS
jgi:hypothetical protein